MQRSASHHWRVRITARVTEYDHRSARMALSLTPERSLPGPGSSCPRARKPLEHANQTAGQAVQVREKVPWEHTGRSPWPLPAAFLCHAQLREKPGVHRKVSGQIRRMMSLPRGQFRELESQWLGTEHRKEGALSVSGALPRALLWTL